jgi:hypothetical protein
MIRTISCNLAWQTTFAAPGDDYHRAHDARKQNPSFAASLLLATITFVSYIANKSTHQPYP